nr:hypothetical protein [uncultured Desulfobacter sp.]
MNPAVSLSVVEHLPSPVINPGQNAMMILSIFLIPRRKRRGI